MQDAPLTAGDVATISAGRLVLRGIQRRAEHRSSLHLLADAVEGELFDVLNVASSYYNQPIGKDVLYLQRDGERPAEARTPARHAGEQTPPAELVTMLDALTVNACRQSLKAAKERLPHRDGLGALCQRAEAALFDLLLVAQVSYDVPLTRVEVFGYDPDPVEPEPPASSSRQPNRAEAEVLIAQDPSITPDDAAQILEAADERDRALELEAELPEPEPDRRAELEAELAQLAGVHPAGDDVAAERRRRLEAELAALDDDVPL